MSNPPYLKFYGRDLFVFTNGLKKSEKAAILDAIIHLNMYGFWPAEIQNLCKKSEKFSKNFQKIDELFSKCLENYNKICIRNLQNASMKSLKNKDISNPVATQPHKQVETHSLKQKKEAEAEEYKRLTAANRSADKVSKPKRELNDLQKFSNQVIENFEPDIKTDTEKAIWFKRNCRCLSDILNFCGKNIPLAIGTIDACIERMGQAKIVCFGYEAVCRNLPYYREEAKKKLGGAYA